MQDSSLFLIIEQPVCRCTADTVEERNYLLSHVFPQLKDYCRARHGIEFHALDMRWGIPVEVSRVHVISCCTIFFKNKIIEIIACYLVFCCAFVWCNYTLIIIILWWCDTCRRGMNTSPPSSVYRKCVTRSNTHSGRTSWYAALSCPYYYNQIIHPSIDSNYRG